jgi:hypothetical protein
MKLFYTIWTDGIIRITQFPKNKDDWKFKILLIMTMAMAFNIALFMAILERNILHSNFYNINLDFIPEEHIRYSLEFFILYVLAPLLINYFLIFHKNRYEKIIQKYKYYNGKLYAAYFVSSFFLPLVLLFLGYFWTKLF